MTIQIDSREKPKATELIKAHFDRTGVKWFVSKLPVGDYQSLDNARLCVDRKQSLAEVCTNLCQQEERFRRELERARDLEIKLVFLVEHSKAITTLSDVRYWQNPRKAVSPYALDGWDLYRRMVGIENHYGTAFYFCDKGQTGQKIIELLIYGGRPYEIKIGK